MSVQGDSSSTPASAAIDSNSPFFLHHGDSPGNVLVTQLLNGDNYYSWKMAMTVALEAKNKLEFVNGVIVQPAVGSDMYLIWRRCDRMIMSWLLNSISKDIAYSVVGRSSSREVWLDLAERFSQGNLPRIFQITMSISNLKQGDASVTVYFTKLKTLWNELSNYKPFPTCTCDECHCGLHRKLKDSQEEERVMQFLMGLNEQYASVRDQLLLTEPLPPLNVVFAKVVQQERQSQLKVPSSHSGQNMAMYASNSHQGHKPNHNYGKQQHNHNYGKQPAHFPTNASANGKFDGRGSNGKVVVCTHFGHDGHDKANCYRLIGFPPDFRFTRSYSKAHNAHAHNVTTDFSSGSRQASPPRHVSNSMESPKTRTITLSEDQCQQLASLLQSQVTTKSVGTSSEVASVAGSVSPFSSSSVSSPFHHHNHFDSGHFMGRGALVRGVSLKFEATNSLAMDTLNTTS